MLLVRLWLRLSLLFPLSLFCFCCCCCCVFVVVLNDDVDFDVVDDVVWRSPTVFLSLQLHAPSICSG